MSVGRLEEIEAPDPGHEPWLAHTDRLPFPVEWSCQFDILSGGDAKQAIQRKLLVVRDMQRHYAEHELDEPLALDRQARQAREVEDQMTRGVDVVAARVHGWFRVAVAARTEDECLERVRQVITSYRSRRVTIEHPKGQYGLLREFIPGEPVSTSAYRRRLPVLYFSAGVPMASSRLGDRRGPYVGFTAGSSRRAVMFDTHYATEERETSGLVPIVGGLGAGKSVLIGQITYEAVRRGIPSVVLDPSGPLARLTELPELREHSQHLDLTTAASGTLNPFEVVAAPLRAAYPNDEAFAEAEVLAAQDRKLLAMDVAKMLLPASVNALPQTSLVISDAVRSTRGDRGSVPVGHCRAPRRVVEPAWTGGCELPARHGRAAVVAAVLPQGRQRSGSDVRRADGADHARAGPSASVGAAGPLVDIRAARRTAAASGFLVCDPGGVRTGDAEPQAGRARRDPLPRRVVGRSGALHPPGPGLPKVEHLCACRVTEPRRRSRHGRRELHGRRVRGPDRGRGRRTRRSPDAASGHRCRLRARARQPVVRAGCRGVPGVRDARCRWARRQGPRRPVREPGASCRAQHDRRPRHESRSTRNRSRDGHRPSAARAPHHRAVGGVDGAGGTGGRGRPGSRTADPGLPVPDLPVQASGPGDQDCKESPTPDMPGHGIAGFFSQRPATLPAEEDPFVAGSSTTIYEQYGYSGLRWHTYDLGCGPDAMRQPDAVIGTAVSNWIMQLPIALTALTGSLTQVAFEPTFLGVFNPVDRAGVVLAAREPVRILGAGGDRSVGPDDPVQGAPFRVGHDGGRDRLGADRGDPGHRAVPVAVGRGRGRGCDGDRDAGFGGEQARRAQRVGGSGHRGGLQRGGVDPLPGLAGGHAGKPRQRNGTEVRAVAVQGPGADLARGRGCPGRPRRGQEDHRGQEEGLGVDRVQDPGRRPRGLRAPHRVALGDPIRVRRALGVGDASWRSRSCCCPRCCSSAAS